MWVIPFKIDEENNVIVQPKYIWGKHFKQIQQVQGEQKQFRLWKFIDDKQTYLNIVRTYNNTITVNVEEGEENIQQRFIQQITDIKVNQKLLEKIVDELNSQTKTQIVLTQQEATQEECEIIKTIINTIQ